MIVGLGGNYFSITNIRHRPIIMHEIKISLLPRPLERG